MKDKNKMNNVAVDQTSYNYCALPLAVYACRPDRSKGRVFEEAESRYRTCFQRDRDRIIHCTAFRRLKYKTQVFVYHIGDHYRTRLTHSLEVAQVARTLARALMVNEDLAEGVSLAHDLGHTPFAHLGEDVLKVCMKDVGGFDHNDQSLRVLTFLERRYPEWPGLNLTWELLEGIAKHNGPMIEKGQNWKDSTLPIAIKMLQGQIDLQLESYASLEAQIAGLADDIAYNNHDIEDGLGANLFTFDDIQDVPILADVLKNVRTRYPGISGDLLRHTLVRHMIGVMIDDVLTETNKRLKKLNPQSPDDIRMTDQAMVAFSDDMLEKVNALRKFLWERMYHHDAVLQTRDKSAKIVEDLYNLFMEDYKKLPEEWQKRLEDDDSGATDKVARARVVADYIAGMTDRFAMRDHERLFGEK